MQYSFSPFRDKTRMYYIYVHFIVMMLREMSAHGSLHSVLIPPVDGFTTPTLFVASCCHWIEIAEIRILCFDFVQYWMLRLDCEYSKWNTQYLYVCTSFLLLSVHLYYMKLDANENVNLLFDLLSTTAINVAENMKQTSFISLRSHVMFQVDQWDSKAYAELYTLDYANGSHVTHTWNTKFAYRRKC